MNDWYSISNAQEISSPALLVYPQRVEHNLQRMITMAGAVQRLRPHVKCHKSPHLIALQRTAGIHKFKAATIAEAEMTAAAGGEDILLACQPVGPQLQRFVTLMQRFPATRFATLVDDAYQLAAIAHAALGHNLQIALYLDLDVGMHRTGIAPGDAAAALYRAICRTAGVVAAGLHAYDGHLRDAGPVPLHQQVEQTFAPVWQLREQLRADGFEVPGVVAGGTPTFALLAQRGDVEVGPGTPLLWDWGQAQICPQHNFLYAAAVLARVISKPTPERLCLDLGHKAVASEMPQPRMQFFGLEDAVAVGHSEEHLVLQTPRGGDYQVGDVVYGIPRHIGPTMALHDAVWAVRQGAAAQRWPVVARSRLLSI